MTRTITKYWGYRPLEECTGDAAKALVKAIDPFLNGEGTASIADQEFKTGPGLEVRDTVTDLAAVKFLTLGGDCVVTYHERTTERGAALSEYSRARLGENLSGPGHVFGVGSGFGKYHELPPVHDWCKIMAEVHPGLAKALQGGACKQGVVSVSMNYIYFVLGLGKLPGHQASSDAICEAEIYAAMMRFALRHRGLGCVPPSAVAPPRPHPDFPLEMKPEPSSSSDNKENDIRNYFLVQVMGCFHSRRVNFNICLVCELTVHSFLLLLMTKAPVAPMATSKRRPKKQASLPSVLRGRPDDGVYGEEGTFGPVLGGVDYSEDLDDAAVQAMVLVRGSPVQVNGLFSLAPCSRVV